jgi:hypothetical protein
VQNQPPAPLLRSPSLRSRSDGWFLAFPHINVEPRRGNIIENDLFWVGNGRLIRGKRGTSPTRRDPRVEEGHFSCKRRLRRHLLRSAKWDSSIRRPRT